MKRLTEVYGEDIIKAHEIMGYNKIICPVCGNETFDDYFICPHCNWEADFLMSDTEYSPANRSTIKKARRRYNRRKCILRFFGIK